MILLNACKFYLQIEVDPLYHIISTDKMMGSSEIILILAHIIDDGG